MRALKLACCSLATKWPVARSKLSGVRPGFRTPYLLTGAASAFLAFFICGLVVSGETASATKTKFSNDYVDLHPAAFSTTSPASAIRQCLDLNVRSTGLVSDDVFFEYPYGSIESQRVSAAIGGKTILVVTRLRDVNVDLQMSRTSHHPLSARTEFLYGCGYLTASSTTVTVVDRNTSQSLATSKSFSYSEDPRKFHRRHYVTKTFRVRIELPRPITKADLSGRKYCISSLQESHSITRPFDLTAVEVSSPGQGYKLLDPSLGVGMIDYGAEMPAPKSVTFQKCMTKSRQYSLKPQKGSPWTYYPY